MKLTVTVLVVASALGCTKSREDATREVADDMIKRYEMARTSGGAMDRCAAAGMVSAAMQQAHDDDGYAKYKAIERQECRAAGVTE